MEKLTVRKVTQRKTGETFYAVYFGDVRRSMLFTKRVYAADYLKYLKEKQDREQRSSNNLKGRFL